MSEACELEPCICPDLKGSGCGKCRYHDRLSEVKKPSVDFLWFPGALSANIWISVFHHTMDSEGTI